MTDNSEILLYTSVGLTARFSKRGSKVNATRFGLLYVKDEKLCHDKTLGNMLMSTKSWKLSDIKQITAINGCDLMLPATEISIIPPLYPGIKIVLQDSTGSDTTLVMALPYTTIIPSVNYFCTKLGQLATAAKRGEAQLQS